jgi:inner membrane protein YidH
MGVMTHDYRDYAANERTFLAWLRTGIAVVAFGFVIERFNFFARTIAGSLPPDQVHQARPEIFGVALGAGHLFMFIGTIFIGFGIYRLWRTWQMLQGKEDYAPGIRTEVILAAILAASLVVISVYLLSK